MKVVKCLDPTITAAIATVAAAHHGVITATTAAPAGISGPALRRRAAAAELLVRHDAYVVPELMDDWTEPLLLSRRSAHLAISFGATAALYGWDDFDRPPSPIPLVAPWTSRPDLKAYRRLDLSHADLRVVEGIRTTSPLWTLAHLGECESPDRVELALESALREKHVTEAELWTQSSLHPLLHQRGVGARPTGSWLETKALQRVLRPAGLRVLGRQVEVYQGGYFHGRPDFLLEGWVLLEVDGGDHATLARSRSDNDRDLRMGGLGLFVARLDHRQVVRASANSARRLATKIAEGRTAHEDRQLPFDGYDLRFPS